ncbi:acyl-CoA thioesterase [Cellulophaga omnivescoria]|uniref:acyl-CoA thioesterase n=1 Tax=Cellulophaga omnivescoria TaxID=1888890 RepID=UPI0022F0687B|nr:thioesterase family protein [Cellulophaga omnivescoria]WBU89418.1 thioesterase family protein [Cellulophaga omnivescoria]
MRKNKISFTVRYGETDQMGVVYHGNYAQYLELGRLSWLKDLDVSYKKMEETGVVLPVISLQINFKKSALYDDTLTVVTKLKKKPSVKIEFDYEIYNENDELLVTANTVLAFLNKETKKPIKCPEYVLKKIDEFYDF